MKSGPAFVLGSLAGILAGVLAVEWLVPARPAEVHAGPEHAPHAPAVARSDRPAAALEAPLEDARTVTAAERLEQARTQAALPPAASAAPGDEPQHTLPTLRRCLLDPELNPAGLACGDPAVQSELQHFIDQKNAELGRIESQRDALVDSLLSAKLAANVDPPETWSTYPHDDILVRRYHASVGTSGPGKTEATILRRGESPDIDALEHELDGTLALAREELRQRIAQGCRR